MADPFDTGAKSSFDASAARAKDDLNARFQTLRREATARGDASDRFGAEPGPRIEGRYGEAAGVRDQAEAAAAGVKGAAASMAEQARARINDIVGQQKAAGADKIAGVARAAHSAAGELDGTNPRMAKLVRNAADGVDRIADDVRSRDIGDVLATVADFGRRQPVAFFGGAVLAGFLLSRFFKSDAPLIDDASSFGDQRF